MGFKSRYKKNETSHQLPKAGSKMWGFLTFRNRLDVSLLSTLIAIRRRKLSSASTSQIAEAKRVKDAPNKQF